VVFPFTPLLFAASLGHLVGPPSNMQVIFAT
jgi:hypothetical protein